MKLSTRCISFILAVMLIVSSLSIGVSAQTELKTGIGFVTASALRLRSGPSTDTETIDIAYTDEVVVVLGQEEEWYKVIYNLQEGYMHSDYLSVLDCENAELGYGRVNGDYVNMRKGPNTTHSIVNQANTGDEAYIIGLNRGWYKVIYEDDICYIRSDFLDLTEFPYENIESDNSPLFFRGGFSIGVDPSPDALDRNNSDSDYEEDDSDDDDDYEYATPDDSLGTLGQAIADKALTYNGYPYVWGGASPNSGFDCSGFTYYIAKCFGYSIPHGSESQYRYGTYVAKEDLIPGDFVFFANTYTDGISHCGIYIGDGEFIHASSSTTGVKISSLHESYYISHYHGARRLF